MAVFFDDFNRANNATVGSGWSEDRATAFEVFGNQLKGSTNGTQYWLNQAKAPVAGSLQDGDIITHFKFDTSTSGVPQIHGRDNGADSFYIVYILSTSITIARYFAGLTPLTTAVTFAALQVNRLYRLQLSMDGTFIRAILHDAEDGTHIATVGGVDSSITASGNSCLSVGAGGSPVLYDNFTVIPAIERSIIYDESFLDGNNHIGHLTTTGTVAVATYKNSKKLKFTGASASATDSYVEPSVPYIIQANMEAPNTNAFVLEGLDASNNVIFTVRLNGWGPYITFVTDNDTSTNAPWVTGTPEQVQVLIDPMAKTARCFYSNGTGAPGDTWPAVSAAKSYTNVSIVKWRVASHYAGSGDSYLDEVKIHKAGLAWVGDSITSGHGLSAGGVPEWGANPNDNSRGRASEAESHYLPYQYMLLDDGTHIPKWGLGRGVDGDESGDVDIRINGDVVDPGSTGAVVWIGTNDINNNTLTLAQTKVNTTSIIDKLQSGGIALSEIYLVECAPRAFSGTIAVKAQKNADKDALNVWLAGEAFAQGCNLVLVHDALEGSADLLHANYDATDGIHLNTAGLKLVAETILTATVPSLKGALFSRHLRQMQTA